MSVLTLVQPGRWLDSIVFGFMLMFLCGASLYGFGLAHNFIMTLPTAQKGSKVDSSNPLAGHPMAGLIPPFFPLMIERVFPMPGNGKKWSFSLTHVLLFAVLVCLLSMSHHPAQDRIEENAILQRKKKEKKEGSEKAEWVGKKKEESEKAE